MVSLIIVVTLVGLAFAPKARRVLLSTVSCVLTALTGVLLFVWVIGSRSRRFW